MALHYVAIPKAGNETEATPLKSPHKALSSDLQPMTLAAPIRVSVSLRLGLRVAPRADSPRAKTLNRRLRVRPSPSP